MSYKRATPSKLNSREEDYGERTGIDSIGLNSHWYDVDVSENLIISNIELINEEGTYFNRLSCLIGQGNKWG